jgi:hypothetical protein
MNLSLTLPCRFGTPLGGREGYVLSIGGKENQRMGRTGKKFFVWGNHMSHKMRQSPLRLQS